MRRSVFAALSFANIVYLRAWTDLIPATPKEAFYRKSLAAYGLYFGIAADVMILAALTLGVLWAAPKLPGWIRRSIPATGIALIVLAIRGAGSGEARSGALGLSIAGAGAALGVAAILRPRVLLPFLRGTVLAAVPCLAVTFVALPALLAFQKPLPPDPPRARRLSGRPSARVLWILFDDWDERLTFEDRSPELALPAIDALTMHSFRADHALAVQAGRRAVIDMSTLSAVPALVHGRLLDAAEVENASAMRLDVHSKGVFGSPVSALFGSEGSVFARARERGWNTAAAGWYLPYCRVAGAELNECYWDVRYLQSNAASPDFAQGALDETRMLFETTVLSPFGPALVAERHEAEYRAILATGRRYAADPAIGLTMIHFNIPHAPYFYDPKIGRSLAYGKIGALYNDALEQVDRSIAEILASVRAAGLEGTTALIVSSDHPFRFSPTPDPDVPFIVHLPGETEGAVWSRRFSAVVSADLAMAIAGGDVRSAEDVAEFIERR